MPIVDIVVPKWGLEIEEVRVIEWVKALGDRIEAGEPIILVETDKASGEIEAEVSGRLVEILAEPDQEFEVGALLGRIETDG
jgi:pyruvate/2-oxoglutarate dehydrogenase complex dihydrolipoamide acyltransferase (E2) component